MLTYLLRVDPLTISVCLEHRRIVAFVYFIMEVWRRCLSRPYISHRKYLKVQTYRRYRRPRVGSCAGVSQVVLLFLGALDVVALLLLEL